MTIDRAVAESIAQEYVREMRRDVELPDGDDLVIGHRMTKEIKSGWIFYYTSRIYLETEDPDYSLVGNRPFIVSKKDGAIKTYLEEKWWQRWHRRWFWWW